LNSYRKSKNLTNNQKTKMAKFKYDMELNESNEKDADAKMRGLATLGAKVKAEDIVKLSGIDAIKIKGLAALSVKLNTKEISALANIVENDPIKTALAKKYLGL
jgi:hypothetical protein